MRIALSTGGGDAPGLNAVIRAAVLAATRRGWDVLGIKRGYAGLLGDDEVIPLTAASVRGIAHMGGTILGTTNRGSPFRYPVRQPDGGFIYVDRSDELMERARALGIDAVISIGGDGSLKIARQLGLKGMRVVSVPRPSTTTSRTRSTRSASTPP
jgi:6-phosphofructokinase 1